MATAEDYAQWIVSNADKKGTAEFDTVAKAYQQARGQASVTETTAPVAAKADKPAEQPVVESEHPTLAFVGGNLNKVLTSQLGNALDLGANIGNAAVAGYGLVKGALGGQPPDLPFAMPGTGAALLEKGARKIGLITPEADPTSKGGEYAASAIQAIPYALTGKPNLAQLPRAVTGAITSGLGAQLGRDVAPEGWEEVGSVVGAAAPGAKGMKVLSAAERATADRMAALFAKAKELGVPIPPRLMKPDVPQQQLQNSINRELKLPPGTELSPTVLDDFIGAHYKFGYQPVITEPKLNGMIVANKTFNQSIDKIEQSEARLRKEFPESTKDSGVQKIINDLRQGPTATGQPGIMSTIEKTATEQPGPPIMRTLETAASQTPGPKSYGEGSPAPARTTQQVAGPVTFTTGGVMEQIKRLRESATNNLNSPNATDDTIRLGRHQRKIATALEKLVEDNLTSINSPTLLKQFQDSRKAMAQAYNTKASLDPTTGKINPVQFARLQSEGAPLTGELKNIAEIAKGFPQAVKSPSVGGDDFFTHKMSPWAVAHPPSLAAHLMTRLLDPVTTSRPYQAMFVNPANKLTPDQQRIMRLLIGAQQQTNNQ